MFRHAIEKQLGWLWEGVSRRVTTCKVIAIFSVFHFMIAKYYCLVSVISIRNEWYCCFVCYCSRKPWLQDTTTAGHYQGRPAKTDFNDVYEILERLNSAVSGIIATLSYTEVLTSLRWMKKKTKTEVRKWTRKGNVCERKTYIIRFLWDRWGAQCVIRTTDEWLWKEGGWEWPLEYPGEHNSSVASLFHQTASRTFSYLAFSLKWGTVRTTCTFCFQLSPSPTAVRIEFISPVMELQQMK